MKERCTRDCNVGWRARAQLQSVANAAICPLIYYNQSPMSHFQPEPQRPVMPRRKSSAQNLLSSFKNSSSSASIPPPLNLANSSGPVNSTSMSFASAATPTVSTTPMPRDWDSQSLHSEPVGPALTGAQSPPLGQSTTVEVLRDTLQKRIMTLTYIRNIHEGYVCHVHLFSPSGRSSLLSMHS